MNFIKNIIGIATGGLVGQIGDIIDRTSTSDEEREALKLEAQKAVQTYELALGEQLQNAEVQLTERQKTDMASDSWLSKNVRPVVLMFLTVSVILLAYLSIFALPVNKAALVEPWIDLVTTVMLAAYSFYFGGRTIEKFQTIRKR